MFSVITDMVKYPIAEVAIQVEGQQPFWTTALLGCVKL